MHRFSCAILLLLGTSVNTQTIEQQLENQPLDLPIVVGNSMYVKSLSISDGKCELMLTWRQCWKKPSEIRTRQASFSNTARLWKPDTFISNALLVKSAGGSNSQAMLVRAGTICYSQMVNVKVELARQKSPLLAQSKAECRLTIGSYANDVNTLVYEWIGVKLSADLAINAWEPTSVRNSTHLMEVDVGGTRVGVFSAARATIKLNRDGSELLNMIAWIYLPTNALLLLIIASMFALPTSCSQSGVIRLILCLGAILYTGYCLREIGGASLDLVSVWLLFAIVLALALVLEYLGVSAACDCCASACGACGACGDLDCDVDAIDRVMAAVFLAVLCVANVAYWLALCLLK